MELSFSGKPVSPVQKMLDKSPYMGCAYATVQKNVYNTLVRLLSKKYSLADLRALSLTCREYTILSDKSMETLTPKISVSSCSAFNWMGTSILSTLKGGIVDAKLEKTIGEKKRFSFVVVFPHCIKRKGFNLKISWVGRGTIRRTVYFNVVFREGEGGKVKRKNINYF